MSLMRRLLCTGAPRATVLVRILVGGVFFVEGVQKLIFPAMGADRFAQIGIPAPQIMGPFVGVVETVCGALVVLGLLTRIASIPLTINISVAILSTKIPILIGRGFYTFAAPKGHTGVWSMLHESRTDFSMLLGLIFLLIVGAGGISLDALFARRAAPERPAGQPAVGEVG